MTAMTAFYAEALFCSPLQPSERPTSEAVRAAVEEAVHGWRLAMHTPCVAQEFGDHPELAAERMQWCLAAVRAGFATAGVR